MENQQNSKTGDDNQINKNPASQDDTSKDRPAKQEQKKHRASALEAASIGRSATAQVDPHSNRGLADTGTNISYEGATAPGAGGSVGTGEASGQEATGETISANSDFVQNRATSINKKENNSENTAEEKDII